MRAAVLTVLVLAGGVAHAEPSGDGYCDYIQGVAAANSAVLFAPTLYTQFGLVEQSAGAVAPDVNSGGLRLIAGMRVSLDGIYKGLATRDRARADCRRHTALEQVRGETTYQALDARAAVLDKALVESEKILKQTASDLEARRTTAQEATATRLRVEDLRRAATENAAQLSALPAPSNTSLAGAVAAYARADADMEDAEARIRRWSAIDLTVRAGVDQYLAIDTGDRSPFFGVVSLGVNLGVLFQGSGNARAASGRKRMLASGRDPLSQEHTLALAQAASRRASETATLEADLKRQLDALDRVGGDDSRRYRLIVWFDWIKARAEHAYHEALAAALEQVVGGR